MQKRLHKMSKIEKLGKCGNGLCTAILNTHING
uniref:4Fe-4S domain-containing protein n=1 Tax=Heterorhabditis bacteriophora TaxID=37862 RepID=A0A1I7WH00_HETBA